MRKSFVFSSLMIFVSMIISACNLTSTPNPVTEEMDDPTSELPVSIDPGRPNSNFIYATSEISSDTLDPALAYDTASRGIIFNVYETLIFFDGESTDTFTPMLASEMPTVSADGRIYTFKIRPGVKFHNGNQLTASDVAYSFQRGILQGGYSSPQWLLAEPFLGIGNDDITMIVDGGASADDRYALMENDPAILRAACEKVKASIVADDSAGRVTMTLAQPWSPFLATIAQTWGSVMDQEWVVANGGWDGSCDTWQNFYSQISSDDPFSKIENGTGPFQLEEFREDDVLILTRNDEYWREPAKLERIAVKQVTDWEIRSRMMQVGDADTTDVPADKRPQMDALVGEFQVYEPYTRVFNPVQEVCWYDALASGAAKFIACAAGEQGNDQPFRLNIGQPVISQSVLLFNWNIATSEVDPNPYIGSGKLDGNGIPPDFFSDVNIRKAFAYCFDWDALLQVAFSGDAIQSIQLPLPGMPGHFLYTPHYHYDPAKCEAKFKLADIDKDGIPAGNESNDGGDVWNIGFRFQLVYPQSSEVHRTVAEILAKNLAQVNDKFMIDTLGLLPKAYMHPQAENSPLLIISHSEEIHDPLNWYQPFTTGVFSDRQSLPEDLMAKFNDILNRTDPGDDPAKRAETYREANQLYYDQCVGVPLVIETTHYFTQRWIQGMIFNPTYPGIYYYPIYIE
jgi:peptide/nickel transport system substrate-binding protein